MPRQKKQAEKGLIAALKFVKLSGAKFCSIKNNQIIAFTNEICMGFSIEEDLNAYAEIESLLHSLQKAGEQTAITQIDVFKLHVNSGELQIYINCIEKMPEIQPDQMQFEIDSRLTKAIEILSPIVSARGENLILKTFLNKGRSLFATNRFLIAEYWHGLDLPNMIFSKKFAEILLKSKKAPTVFGFSNNSLTIYFNDNSWIMGRILNENWPDVESILNKNEISYQLSEDYFKALAGVSPFSDTDMLYCANGCLQSHPEAGKGASYPVACLVDGSAYSVKDSAFLLRNATEAQICQDGSIKFFNKDLRGIIASRKV